MRLITIILTIASCLFVTASSAAFNTNNAFSDGNAFGTENNRVQLPNSESKFVPVNQAFPFNAFQNGDKITIDWQIKPGYYLYKDRLSIKALNAEIEMTPFPVGKAHHDEFFGDVTIYTEPLFIDIQLSQRQANSQLIVEYQGCASDGFCYPPERKIVAILPNNTASNSQPVPSQTDAPIVEKDLSVVERASSELSSVGLPSAQIRLADQLHSNRWTPLLFFILGVGLAFTPCVLPMYPILTSLVLGHNRQSKLTATKLSLIYIQGMALTYTLLGLIVASAGLQFQAALQSPIVLIGLSTLFVLLSLSMFGVYTLQLPSLLQTKLNQLSNEQSSGKAFGVFTMGAISGLVCSPCTTAPLSGALLYVAQSGDQLTGAITLYLLALGMGLPLLLVAVFGHQLLPKSGAWMEKVKIAFGFILLSAPLFLLERLLPELWSTLLWSLLGICAFGWLYISKNDFPFSGWKQTSVGIIAVLGIIAAFKPALDHWAAKPIKNQYIQTANPSNLASTPSVSEHPDSIDNLHFIRIKTIADLKQQLNLAKQARKPVMLDFYADWCVACKEFETKTFSQREVKQKLSSFVLLQADVTKSDRDDVAILEQMHILGLPTIHFWDKNGNTLNSARITGFMNDAQFLSHLQQNQL
jgi:thiol:disulfide interchange protein DsbD